jgi:GT2 family glycosyltransferase
MVKFSIIIPVKPGGYAAAIDCIRRAGLDNTSFEIFRAEGSVPSRQRNLAAEQAQGEILYFLDDDSCLNPGNLQTCSAMMNDQAVAVVGGPSITPASDSRLQRLFGYALGSLLGGGPVRNRYRSYGVVRETTEKELILCNLAIRRSVYLDIGGLDERLYPNEENELLDRISAAGLKLMHDPAMIVQRSQRPTFQAFTRQMFSYGRGRAQQSLLSKSWNPVSFVPLLFVSYLVMLPFATVLFQPSIAPLALYIMLIVISTFESLYTTRSPLSCGLLLLVPYMHVVNGCGLIFGLLARKPVRKSGADIKIIRIKGFDQNPW